MNIPEGYKELLWEDALPGQVTWAWGVNTLVPIFVLVPSERCTRNSIGQACTQDTLMVPETGLPVIDMLSLSLSLPLGAVVSDGNDDSRRQAAAQIQLVGSVIRRIAAGEATIYAPLPDWGPTNAATKHGAIRLDNGIEISVDGYGTNTVKNSAPIYIENDQGTLRCRVWSDINQEEPTHCIGLEGAREESYERQ